MKYTGRTKAPLQSNTMVGQKPPPPPIKHNGRAKAPLPSNTMVGQKPPLMFIDQTGYYHFSHAQVFKFIKVHTNFEKEKMKIHVICF
jgi:hypothetical protein